MNPKIHSEWRRALLAIGMRHGGSEAVVEEALVQCELLAKVCPPVEEMPPDYVVPALGSHTKDAHLFWAAERGQAKVIITRDETLRGLGSWRGVPILQPYPALRQLGLDEGIIAEGLAARFPALAATLHGQDLALAARTLTKERYLQQQRHAWNRRARGLRILARIRLLRLLRRGGFWA